MARKHTTVRRDPNESVTYAQLVKRGVIRPSYEAKTYWQVKQEQEARRVPMAKAKPPTRKVIADDGQSGISVSPWTSSVFGIKPHVVLTVGALKGKEPGTSVKLTPLDARRVAIALIQSAEKAEGA